MTAIPYVNSTPHIGNILTTLSGDVTARYYRMRGMDVNFQSGTDENGLKIKEAAEANGQEVHGFVKSIAQRFIDIFAELNLSHDSFVRTTSPEHVAATHAVFSKLQEAGYIYQDTYEGWYDVSTETYYKEEELVNQKSPDGNEVRWMSETNYFFRLSAFQDRLLAAYESGEIRVVPATRQNEVISFIKQGLRDTCVSRANPGWGITVPGDESQVVYVWFDAVINYLTAVGYPDESFRESWPPKVQWLGKDILTRFHATLWPAMLMGLGLEIPPLLAAHAWILVGSGEKMSKSRGNVVEPLVLRSELVERAGLQPEIATDAIRYGLVATMGFENDTNYTDADFDRRYNSDLANDLGNALNRSLAMAHKFVGGVIPDAEIDPAVIASVTEAKQAFETAMESVRLDAAVESAIKVIRFINKYIDEKAPWALAKNQDPALPGVIRSMLFAIRSAAALLRPVMPSATTQVDFQLGCEPITDWNLIGTSDSLPAGTKLQNPSPIFPRLELKPMNPIEEKPAAPKPEKPAKPEPTFEPIGIEDFMKVQLKVGRVIEAEPVEKSDKLVKLQVDLGSGDKRQILAGIRKAYDPIDLIGRQVIVVANLKPAKLMGHDSQGMLLAATNNEGLAVLLQPEAEVHEGAGVK